MTLSFTQKINGKPTHYLEVDQWKPDGERQQHAETSQPLAPEPEKQPVTSRLNDDLPF